MKNIIFEVKIMSVEPGSGGGKVKRQEIILLGKNPFHIIENSKFVDPGFKVNGYINGEAFVVCDKSKLNVSVPGRYNITYSFNSPDKTVIPSVIRVVIVDNKTGGFFDPLDDFIDNTRTAIKNIFKKNSGNNDEK